MKLEETPAHVPYYEGYSHFCLQAETPKSNRRATMMQKNELPLLISRRGIFRIFEMRICRYELCRLADDFDSRVVDFFDGLFW